MPTTVYFVKTLPIQIACVCCTLRATSPVDDYFCWR